MRKFLAIAAVAALGLSASPAAADPLTGLMGLLNSGRNVSSTLTNGCSGTGISQLYCQASRVNDVSQTIEYQRQQAASRQQQIIQRQNTINQALIRACRAGDQYSCQRAGPQADPRVAQITEALDTACQAGDRDSCSRASAIRNQQIGYAR